MTRPTHVSLFTGIGGVDLAAEWAGFETVAMCERDPYCRKVLAKHWPDVPVWEDVHAVTAESLRSAGIGRIDLLSGGFPCQPFSVAGKQRGTEDDRHLWPEMLRVIADTRPTWVLGENVAGFVPMALDLVLADLESAGYEAIPFVLPAASVGAPHLRQRCFIVAYAEGIAERKQADKADAIATGGQARQKPRKRGDGARGRARALADSECSESRSRLETNEERRRQDEAEQARMGGNGGEWIADRNGDQWRTQSPICGVAYGVSPKLVEDRLRALGNAVVPQQVYPILCAIHEQIRQEAA